ncbi:MAG: serine/threonine-protein kinase [Polyangia bacterium]
MTLPSREGELALGRYKLARRIGRGTFGEVYVAESLQPQATGGRREVVLKVLHTQWAKVAEVVERFRREAVVTRRIAAGPRHHPHIAEVYEYAQLDDGVPFIAMEYLPGRSLRDELAHGPLPYAEGLELLIGIADALSAAHRAGVVHRDLKPENIQLVEREGKTRFPVVLDFGIAKFLDSAEKLTMTGTLLGTPTYMSPEQFRGESNIGPGADVYALGVLAFEVLAGCLPFSGRSFAELAVAHTSDPPARLPGVPPLLADLINRCLAKDPAQRPRSDLLVQSLRGLASGAPLSQLADTGVIDPFGATGRVGDEVRSAVHGVLPSDALRQAQQQYRQGPGASGSEGIAAQQTQLSTPNPYGQKDLSTHKVPHPPVLDARQKNLLTVMLAVAVFILTGALGLAAYFLLR